MRPLYSALLTSFLALAAWIAPVTDAIGQPTGATLLVRLQNDAAVTPDVVAKAQAEVGRLFGLIGVHVEWITDVPQHAECLRVVSLTTWEPGSRARQSALGFTPVGPERAGCRAYVFVRRMERACVKFKSSIYNLLAASIAHELGHMLLPLGSHDNRGLMEPDWDANHFRSASAGLLLFSAETATRIRARLIEEVRLIADRTPE
jgi:hypothetical protein